MLDLQFSLELEKWIWEQWTMYNTFPDDFLPKALPSNSNLISQKRQPKMLLYGTKVEFSFNTLAKNKSKQQLQKQVCSQHEQYLAHVFHLKNQS
jgi:hypothetical protein